MKVLIISSNTLPASPSGPVYVAGAVYLSPGLPKSYLRELPEALREKQGYFVQFNKPSETWVL